MTLEQYAFLAQIVGAIGVVASLIYVAIQLRQNTAMMRVSASGARVQRDADLDSKISDSPEFAAIWLKGGADFESLEEKERIRLIFSIGRRLCIGTTCLVYVCGTCCQMQIGTR